MDHAPRPSQEDESELDVEDAFGAHDIEYWVRSGSRLVPATPEQIAAIREREGLRRLGRWQHIEQQRTQMATRAARRTARRAAWTEPIVRCAALLRQLTKPSGAEPRVETHIEPVERIDTNASPTDAGLQP